MRKWNVRTAKVLGVIIIAHFLLIFSCDKNKDDIPLPPLNVGLLVDEAGIDDRTFNQSTYEGILLASQDFEFEFDYKVGLSATEYETLIDEFVASGKTLIIGPGYHLTSDMTEAAKKYPEVHFILLDDSPENIPSNMTCVLFKSDEAAFLCGFFSAFWAVHKDPERPMVGWIGGPPIPAIKQITEGYIHGLDYFNGIYHIPIEGAGTSLSSFSDSTNAANYAEGMINAGADVIFAYAGDAGNAALLKTKAFGKWAIGIDSDQYYSFPEVKDILITSCMKNLGTITYQLIENYTQGSFSAGTIIYGNLENEGVGLAPFHDYENQIPDSIKIKLEEIKTGLINGSIVTGLK